jgi:hypothetical protein
MYIFAKFVTDHIFLQNRDKLNIKKFAWGPSAREVSKRRREVAA